METEFIYAVGKRFDSCLIYTTCDKQLFKKNKNETDGGKAYVCYYKQSKCNAKVVIRDGIGFYEEKSHSHSADQEKEYKKFSEEFKIKQRCQSDPNLSLRQIFDEETDGSTSDSNFEKLKSTMISHKKKVLPKNPSSAEEVESYLEQQIVSGLLAESPTALTYLYVKRDDYAYLMFQNINILEKLPVDRSYNINSSMRVVPAGFFVVLLIISVIKKDMAFPCIFVLLSNRSESAYEDVFRKIEERWELNATEAWIDFERALRSTICNVYPGISTKCHWYQYCEAVRLKVKTIDGFYERTYIDQEVKLLFHQFLCLSLAPVDKAERVFQYLKDKSHSYQIFVPVVAYIEKVFMKREGIENLCCDWNKHAKQCSSNYNDYLKKKFCNPDSKCSFLNFIKLLKTEANETTSEYDALISNDEEKKYVQTRRAALFQKERQLLINGSIDIQMFLKRLTFLDNNGCIDNLNCYTVGDELEIDSQNDEDRNGMTAINAPGQLPIQEDVEQLPDTSQSTCVICLIGPKNTMLTPCNHLKFCDQVNF